MHELTFDPHQFSRPRAPVHADYAGNGAFSSTGLSFDDYKRMRKGGHVPCRGRRAAPPCWAVNDKELRAVLARFIERRAGLLRPQSGSYAQRIRRARAQLKSRAPAQSALLDRLCRDYVAAKRKPNASRLREREVQIENLDTRLRMIDPLPIAARLVYLYHRCGLDSVQVATVMHLKPPHVRMILWRLERVSRKYVQHPRLPPL
jgi:hypothetical protein